MEQKAILLPVDEYRLRLQRLQTLMENAGIPACLVSDNSNKYYLTGRVFTGYVFVPAVGDAVILVRRPVDLEGGNVRSIRKPEEIPATLEYNLQQSIGLELDLLSYSAAIRLQKVFAGIETVNISMLLRQARSVKTTYEQEKLRASGIRQTSVYRRIPGLYREGMTDVELQVEIERRLRLEGCLGQFRISGDSMEMFMGSVLVGENADSPSPYDFAMGGRGQDPSLPVGADGTMIRPGVSVMVDMNGNFNGYMTDMTRVFAAGEIGQKARDAHDLSIEICRMAEREMRPGVQASALYERTLDMVRAAGLEDYYMGHRQKAGFIGHGVGIEVNELPVIAPRSHDVFSEGNVVALEPKFVIPQVGAVGIENTYIIKGDTTECLTLAPEQIQQLV